MMLNIFNIFDPMNSTFMSINWLTMMLYMNLMPLMFWLIPSRWNMMWLSIINYMNKELNTILKMNIFKINMFSIFILIMLTNLMGLFSYIFTSSSHMTMNLTLSLPMWLSFMMMGWMFNYKSMLIHQIPMGTPMILMPFMVIIEFISNLIRPGTLSIRLTANMIAGHLLLTLISNNGNCKSMTLSLFIIITQMSLMILELAVAIIQAYVFTILLSLYSQET